MSHRKWLPDFRRRRPRMPPADPFTTRTARELGAVLTDLEIIKAGQPIRVRRVYAGWNQRSEGAWSWAAEDAAGHVLCGSQFTAREIIQAHRAKGRCVSVLHSDFTHDITLFAETGEMCPHDNLIRSGHDGPCGCRVVPEGAEA